MFGLLSGLQAKVILGLILTITLMGAAATWYYKDSQKAIALLNQNNATLEANAAVLETKIDEQNKSILLLDSQREMDQQTVVYMADAHAETQAEVDRLRKQFNRHNMSNLTRKKPGLIEKLINKGTKKVFDEFEMIGDHKSYLPKKIKAVPLKESKHEAK